MGADLTPSLASTCFVTQLAIDVLSTLGGSATNRHIDFRMSGDLDLWRQRGGEFDGVVTRRGGGDLGGPAKTCLTGNFAFSVVPCGTFIVALCGHFDVVCHFGFAAAMPCGRGIFLAVGGGFSSTSGGGASTSCPGSASEAGAEPSAPLPSADPVVGSCTKGQSSPLWHAPCWYQ